MTVLSRREVKASRKPWKCDGCERKFSAGSSYESQSVVNGKFYTIKWCQTCQDIATDLFCDGVEEVNSNDIETHMLEQYGSWDAADAASGTTGVTG